MSRKQKNMRKLQLTVGMIQKRFGDQVIRRANERPQVAESLTLSTGFTSIDQLLGGGLTRGHLVELLGTGTSGQMTVSATTLQGAQKAGQQIVYVDLFQSIDLDLLQRCGIHLDMLVILRPLTFARAIAMTGDLLRHSRAGTIVFDRLTATLAGTHDMYLLEMALPEWNLLLSRQLNTLLIISELIVTDDYPYGRALPHLAFSRLVFQWQEWVYKGRRTQGFISQVTILKNRTSAAQTSCHIRILIEEEIYGKEV